MQQSKPVPISSPDFKARPTPGLSDAVFLPGQPHEFLKNYILITIHKYSIVIINIKIYPCVKYKHILIMIHHIMTTEDRKFNHKSITLRLK